MPIVTVELLEGRLGTLETKKQLAEGITSAFVNAGVPAELLHIIIHVNPRENWARNGKLISERESAQ